MTCVRKEAKKQMQRVRIPQVVSAKDALKLYYTKFELRNADIRALFGERLGTARIAKLKALARDEMRERNVPCLDDYAVNTDCAFTAWGINVDRLESSYAKL